MSSAATTESGSTLQSRRFACDTAESLHEAVELAFDYRGDVTCELTDGTTIVGYLHNRDWDAPPPHIEILPADASACRRIECSQLAAIVFTGIDTAAGKSWDNWLKKVAKAEADGSMAEIYPEPLE